MLQNKNILLGVTGSIAAYKAAILVRALKKEGCNVKVIMTPIAKEFITPLTLATLAGNPILVDFFNPENGEWNSHIKLGIWADAYVIAPATASTIGKMASGVADNLLLTSYLSCRAKVFVAPAMDLDMYNHPTTSRNLISLQNDGVEVIEPASGFLASGLEGKGRMEEPEQIVKRLKEYFTASSNKQLQGKKCVVTAGGSVEKIDAVRYISNNSSGKMGYAIALELKRRGADVTIVRANVESTLKGSIEGVTEVEALSAEQMLLSTSEVAKSCDIIVMAAAVADFTPTSKATGKMKKSDFGSSLSIHLTQTADIAASLGRNKQEGQTLVGFALESSNEIENGIKKLQSKGLDFIVVNSLEDKGACFGCDTNKITIIDKNLTQHPFPLKDKGEVAKDIVDFITQSR